MSDATALMAAGGAVPALPSPFTPAAKQPRGAVGGLLRLAFAGMAGLQGVTVAVAASHLHGTAAGLVAGLGAAGIVLTLATGEWLVRRVVHTTLRPATAAVRRLSAGDLREAIARDARSERSPLLHGLRQMREQLLGIVGQVRTGTVNVAMNAAQVKRDNDVLAERTETQAASLQETAASLEQLTAAVRQTAEIAQEAHALVRTASEHAAQGGAVMREVVDTMGSIRGSSHSIRDIIGVIDGIAFQTNILALNAAVEAARAGDQGRGFAVVASEVRSLAKRCADAAREIKGLIGTSVTQVETGGARVEEAGRAMGEIVTSVRKVADLIGRMDIATREQSSGIETINQAVARIDSTTQGNAQLVQQGVRTVAALQERAASLWKAMEGFALGTHEHATAEEAIRLVSTGCEYLRAHGVHALVDEVNKLDAGRFIHRDLYLMVLRTEDGTFLAHGNNPGRVGTGPQVKDAAGKYFAREMARMARDRGEGWVDYTWLHPVTGETTTKSGYVRRVGEVAVYCAIHKA